MSAPRSARKGGRKFAYLGVDLNEPLNELVMGIVIGEASRRAGKYIGRAGVAALKHEIQTIQHARAYFAARPPKAAIGQNRRLNRNSNSLR